MLDANRVSRARLPGLMGWGVLSRMQGALIDATGLQASIVDDTGEWVTEWPRGMVNQLCRLVQSTEMGHERCKISDRHAAVYAASQEKPYIYSCHAGLVDVAAPIVVGGEFLGAVMCGGVLFAGASQCEKDLILSRTAELGLDRSAVVEAMPTIKRMPRKKVRAAAELLHIMANYIIETEVLNCEHAARAELEAALQQARLAALEARMNPHFLFNALNSVAWQAVLEGAEKTAGLVQGIADLMRYSLRKAGQIATLREEVDAALSYLVIQQQRFGDRVTYRLDVDAAVWSAQLPVLTLQPLVENAVIHGLEPLEGGGTITISAQAARDGIDIRVADTGVGIESQTLERLNASDSNPIQHASGGNGLTVHAVRHRLRHALGERASLVIASEKRQGTAVSMFIPYDTPHLCHT